MNNIEIDSKQVINLFSELTNKQQKETYRKALRSASSILIKQTRTNLRGLIKTSITKKSSKTGKSLSSGVKASINRAATQSTVHIMGDFRLKFFEKGTSIRKTKRGYNRGQIKPNYFFRSAQNATENKIFKEMDNIITQSIIKVNQKYNK